MLVFAGDFSGEDVFYDVTDLVDGLDAFFAFVFAV